MRRDESILAAIERGEPEAWSRLLERYRPFIEGRLKQAARARNWFWLDDLEDAAQEVLVRFYEAVAAGRFTYRDEAQLKGFLVRTAFYVAMKRKDLAVEQAVSDVLAAGGAEALENFEPRAFAASAFDSLGRRQCRQELYAAIERLAPARAQVLRYSLLGLKPREIAPRLKRTPNAVSVLKFHALEDLRAELEQTDFWANCGRYFFEAD